MIEILPERGDDELDPQPFDDVPREAWFGEDQFAERLVVDRRYLVTDDDCCMAVAFEAELVSVRRGIWPAWEMTFRTNLFPSAPHRPAFIVLDGHPRLTEANPEERP